MIYVDGDVLTDQQYYSAMRNEMAEAFDNGGLRTPIGVISLFLVSLADKRAMCQHDWENPVDPTCVKCGAWKDEIE